jgi:hypothetical protein
MAISNPMPPPINDVMRLSCAVVINESLYVPVIARAMLKKENSSSCMKAFSMVVRVGQKRKTDIKITNGAATINAGANFLICFISIFRIAADGKLHPPLLEILTSD